MNDPAGEAGLIQWLRRQSLPSERVSIGIGDDAAALVINGKTELLVTTDMLLEGSCFRLSEAGPRRIGRKAMAVNLSDIAAMAGRPLAAVVAVGLPRNANRQLAEELFEGLREVATQFDTEIVGGDTNSWSGELVISVTVLGAATGTGPVRRSGARPGDWLFVTGALGGSILGHHLDFVPRIAEALLLHTVVELHAMIDISDGFARDLHHICNESKCGAVVDSAYLPISDAAIAMGDGKSPLDHALGDGEDFELLFAVDELDGQRIVTGELKIDVPLFHVGHVVEHGVWLNIDGRRVPLAPLGYEHPFGGKVE